MQNLNHQHGVVSSSAAAAAAADTEKPGAVQDRLDRLVEHAHKYLGPVVAHDKVLFCTRCFVVILLDVFCLFQLASSRERGKGSPTNSKEFAECVTVLCEENKAYFAVLSSTIGYLLPPPKRKKRESLEHTTSVSSRNDEVSSNAFTADNNRDSFDGGQGDEKVSGRGRLRLSVDNVWSFVCCSVRQLDLIFYFQITFVLVLSSTSVLQLSLRNLNCEEKTAYFIILSACLTYLLPPLSAETATISSIE